MVFGEIKRESVDHATVLNLDDQNPNKNTLIKTGKSKGRTELFVLFTSGGGRYK